jgi:multidrug transporter EmrE-like cation transporter
MFKKLWAGIVMALASASSFAALPASVATDAATTAADALTLGGIVLALVVGIALFRHLRSAGK